MPYFVKCDKEFVLAKWPSLVAYVDRVFARAAAKETVPLEWTKDDSFIMSLFA